MAQPMTTTRHNLTPLVIASFRCPQRTSAPFQRGQTPLRLRRPLQDSPSDRRLIVHSEPSSAAISTSGGPPMVEIRFETAEGSRTLVVESGDLLRDVMLNPPSGEKVDVYTTWGKVVNCNGGGQCGTCQVEVLEDPDGLLGERNDVEEGKLRKKPSNYRLACQTNTGDGEVGGSGVVVRTKPK